MANCKTCIHREICENVILKLKVYSSSDCEHFKSSSELSCDGCKHIAFRYPYASMYPCNNCRRANSKDYYNVDLKE